MVCFSSIRSAGGSAHTFHVHLVHFTFLSFSLAAGLVRLFLVLSMCTTFNSSICSRAGNWQPSVNIYICDYRNEKCCVVQNEHRVVWERVNSIEALWFRVLSAKYGFSPILCTFRLDGKEQHFSCEHFFSVGKHFFPCVPNRMDDAIF